MCVIHHWDCQVSQDPSSALGGVGRLMLINSTLCHPHASAVHVAARHHKTMLETLMLALAASTHARISVSKPTIKTSSSRLQQSIWFVCSFYPMYPPAAGALLDSSLAGKLHLPVTPDILLLPSDLNPFAKLVSLPTAPPAEADPALHTQHTSTTSNAGQVVCVNPGRLTKGSGGGTFSCFQVGASEEGRAAALGRAPTTNGKLPHQVHARCKVTVKRV